MPDNRVTVRLSGHNLRGGDMVAILKVGDTFNLRIDADDCENPPDTVKFDYKFEVVSIDV